MAHASLLDVWNAGARTVGQGLEFLSKEKEYELNATAYNAGLKLETDLYKTLEDAQNSNNPEEIQQQFIDRIQNWKDAVAYPAGHNSRYYRDKIENIAAQAGAAFEKKLYEQTLFRGNQRAHVLLAANLDETFAAQDDPHNPSAKLFRGLGLIEDAHKHNIIDDIERRKEEVNWADRILSYRLQTISDAAQNPRELREALDAVSAGDYAGYIPGQTVDQKREAAYRQGLSRIQGQNQKLIRDMQGEFNEKNDALNFEEETAFYAVLNNLTKQANSGAISEEEYRSREQQLWQKYIDGGFQNPTLLRETTALAEKGKAFRNSVGSEGFQDFLMVADFFKMKDHNIFLERVRSGSGSGSGDGDGDDFGYKSLAFGVYAQSMQRPGESAGWSFNEAVESAVSMAEAAGLFRNDDEAGTNRQLFRFDAKIKIAQELMKLVNSNAEAGNYFAKLKNEAKIFMDKRKASAVLGKSAANVVDAELEILQGDLWNNIMNVIAETGTAPETRKLLEGRIEKIYATYTDNKFKILRDNAQSESSAVMDANKTAQALRLIYENPELYNYGYFGDDSYGENIDDTIRAYMNIGANLLTNALGWADDGKTFVDLSGNQVIAARGGEKYRIFAEKRNNRETFVVQKEITAGGEKKWEEQPAIKIDSRNFGDKFIDFLKYLNQGGANPQTRPIPWWELKKTPGSQFGWPGAQGV
jgi:hypothetical protein